MAVSYSTNISGEEMENRFGGILHSGCHRHWFCDEVVQDSGSSTNNGNTGASNRKHVPRSGIDPKSEGEEPS
jgi:hypothetical protein